MSEDLRYPIGNFNSGEEESLSRTEYIEKIATLPQRLRASVQALSENQLETPYRPDGWTVRQVVHHVADSHMNAYIRFRLGLTEDAPTIKPYDEAAWAELSDAKTADLEVSLSLLDRIHERWTSLMRTLPEESFARTFVHPDNGAMTLDAQIRLYDWHGSHHVAHIEALRKRENW
jgi:uncharacterized damage-inducible protein DinB